MKHKTIWQVDLYLLTTIVFLLIFGSIMVYSAAYTAQATGNSYLVRHIVSIIIATIIATLAFNLPSIFWRYNAFNIMLWMIILLILVLIPHIGTTINHSRRWFSIYIAHVQPSELVKLAIIIYIARICTNAEIGIINMQQLCLIVGTLLLICLLLLLEPDMGSATVIFLVAFAMLYIAGLSQQMINLIAVFGIISCAGLIIFEPYRLKRVLSFWNPWHDNLGSGYQLIHSLLAYGHGCWFGVGLGNSIEKLYYLPEAHTDFILAIVAEEFGSAGIAVVFAAFLLILYRGYSIIAQETQLYLDRNFQKLLAQGIVLWLTIQALVNFGVSIGMLPTKGLTMPFLSFGGSSMLVNLVACAILLKIDHEHKVLHLNQKLC